MAWTLNCRRAVPFANLRLSNKQWSMCLLPDTNVVSELMRSSPSKAVLKWATDHSGDRVYFSTIGETEIRYGVAILPIGRRRATLMADIERMLSNTFPNRILPFDSDAARAYANLVAKRQRVGGSISQMDCQIAAIAHARDLIVATRNVRDFEGLDVEIVNPWTAP